MILLAFQPAGTGHSFFFLSCKWKINSNHQAYTGGINSNRSISGNFSFRKKSSTRTYQEVGLFSQKSDAFVLSLIADGKRTRGGKQRMEWGEKKENLISKLSTRALLLFSVYYIIENQLG